MSSKRLAMLIDGDNAQASLLNEMLAEAAKYGVVTIRRVYGNFTETQMKSWMPTLHTYAFTPILEVPNTTGKNATDIALIIDAMDILYTAGVDGFCLVSSDSDYTRLANRIREKNLFVMGIGKQNTPRAFVNACDVFVYTENLQPEQPPAPAKPAPADSKASAAAKKTKTKHTTAKSPAAASTSAAAHHTASAASPAKADRLLTDIQLFRKAFELSVQEDGWAHLANYGHNLRQLDPGFDPRTYGHKQLLMLVKARTDVFEIRDAKKTGETGTHYIRLR